jgi:hypothetical protein
LTKALLKLIFRRVGCAKRQGSERNKVMVKRYVLAVVAIFIAWFAMDFLIHGVILKSAYEATAHLWRPMAEMNMGLMHAITFAAAIAFTGIYALLVQPKSICSGVRFGLLYGLAAGLPMGFGTFSVMPIPLSMAAIWFVGTIVEAVIGGIIAGALIKPCDAGKCCCS